MLKIKKTVVSNPNHSFFSFHLKHGIAALSFIFIKWNNNHHTCTNMNKSTKEFFYPFSCKPKIGLEPTTPSLRVVGTRHRVPHKYVIFCTIFLF